MHPTLPGKLRLLLVVVLLISSSGPNLLGKSSPTRSLEYVFSFDEKGSTLTGITYVDDQPGEGVVWIVVPKGPEKWSLRTLEGRIESSTIRDAETRYGPMIFYDNLTLHYVGPTTIFINWTLEYGALLLEPRGLFVSPAVLASGDVPGGAKLSLPSGLDRINHAAPRYTKISDNVLQFNLREIMQNPAGAGRIYVFFSLSGHRENAEFTEGTYTVTTATRYGELAERVLSVYLRATPILQKLFNTTLGHTYVEFFVPASGQDLPVGGFVPILPDRFSVGNVSLNLFYFRTQEGYMESIALHELVHHYCAKAGIPPSLLWVHEGFANYVSIALTYFLGLPGARDIENSLMREAARIPQNEYHIVEEWTPAHTNPRYSVYQHYSIAYSIVRGIGMTFQEEDEPLPGHNYYSKLFHNIVTKNQRLNSTWQMVSAMELAATNGSKVASMFFMWNFNIPDVYQIYSRIQSLKEKLRNPPLIISWFVPSMLAKLAEAEHLIESEELLLAQELVMEVEAFINRMWMLLGALVVMAAAAFLSVGLEKPEEEAFRIWC